MPKASNEELGAEVSGVKSLETVETETSPYLILTEGAGRGSFLEPKGCKINPSTAAQMRTFRAKLGIFLFQETVTIQRLAEGSAQVLDCSGGGYSIENESKRQRKTED